MAVDSLYYLGLPTVGCGSGQIGAFNPVGSEGPQEAIKRALQEAGGCFLLPGVYQFTAAITGSFTGARILGTRASILKPVASGSVGLFSFTSDNLELKGFQVAVPTFVASQEVIKITGQNIAIEDCLFDCTDSTATGFNGTPGPTSAHTSNTMKLISMANATAKKVRGNTFYPNAGITCFYSEGSGSADSPGNLIISQNIFRSKNADYTPVHTNCFRCIDLFGDEYGIISNNCFFQLGDTVNCDSVMFIRGPNNVLIEGGHILVSGNQIERIVTTSGIKIWGAPSVNFVGNLFGLTGKLGGNSTPANAGEAAICITGQDGTITGTIPLGISIIGNDLHNLAQSATNGAFIFAECCQQLSISSNDFRFCASNNTIRVRAGTGTTNQGVSRFAILNNTFQASGGGATNAIALVDAQNIEKGCLIGNNLYQNFTNKISDATNAGASTRRKILTGIQNIVDGNDVPARYSSTGVTVTGTNTFNDSNNGLAFLATGDDVLVSGSTGAGNNGIHRVTTGGVAGSIVVGTVLTNDASAGETVTFTKVNVSPTTNVSLTA